ncbi:excisionase [Alteromonas sp. Cnat2-8]|uniref:excisionase n=1 Tax=Alteromonas sp. Cnat2-8 TaxID=2917728 RepID=UPI001EF55B25|nr:excisionase [Alteromonas sp. Cnat2-8]MCG7654451.1 excisionase [Alteromonas sp. Cnat2-8]
MSGLVTTDKLSEMTGYTKEAIRMKVKKGVWIKQQHYLKAPDGRLIFIVEMIYQWMKGDQANEC